MKTARDTPEPARNSETKERLPRIFDVVVSLIGLVLSMPLLLAAGFMVAVTSAGGILFKQERVGRNGRLFTLYKLRTMRVSNSGPQVTSGDDVRITGVGRFLRQTKLDELPTLWNVLRGDLSLVGPRPEVPKYVDLEDPQWQLVLEAKPGITDPVTLQLRNEEKLLAQVGGDPEQYYVTKLQPLKLKGYVAYLKSRTWRRDLQVLWHTTVAVIIPSQSLTQTSDGRHDADPCNLLHASNNKECPK